MIDGGFFSEEFCDTLLSSSRASDKKRNLAQQKAEAQRRLYGKGSMKKLSAASSDWEKQRHTLERRKEELVGLACQTRRRPLRPARVRSRKVSFLTVCNV